MNKKVMLLMIALVAVAIIIFCLWKAYYTIDSALPDNPLND